MQKVWDAIIQNERAPSPLCTRSLNPPWSKCIWHFLNLLSPSSSVALASVFSYASGFLLLYSMRSSSSSSFVPTYIPKLTTSQYVLSISSLIIFKLQTPSPWSSPQTAKLTISFSTSVPQHLSLGSLSASLELFLFKTMSNKYGIIAAAAA